MLSSPGLYNFIRGFGLINGAARIIIRQIQNKESYRPGDLPPGGVGLILVYRMLE